MGDRVLIQVVKRVKRDGSKTEFSPVAYGHWSGAATPAVVERLRKRMESRPGDVDYTFARLVQEMIAGDEGALSFGVWNAASVLTAEDSHGDAGVVLIDVTPLPLNPADARMGYGNPPGFRCTCLGGYLKTDARGMPQMREEF